MKENTCKSCGKRLHSYEGVICSDCEYLDEEEIDCYED